MQKLSERNTYTPGNISHVPSTCDHVLNSSNRVRNSVHGLKTSDNNPDATLTATGQAEKNLRVSFVYVLSQRGKPLMPCNPQKARKLLKQGKASVTKRTPFTIQLTHATGETVQPITLGVDSGYLNIGLSAVSETKELYSAEVKLRDDMVKLNSERAMYRRNRRGRKTWYRKPRFLNRGNKKKGWLAPSVQNKLDTHIKVINNVKRLLPIAHTIIEVASFDIQKIKNPSIEGKEYQQEEQSGFWNVREYVLYRDGHNCQHCKGKSKDKILNVHHIESRQIGGDRPSNLITLCETCHNNHHSGKIKLKVKMSKGFKAETFMSMVRWKLVNLLKDTNNNVNHTYGYETKSKRIILQLPKTHSNDAFVIAGGNFQNRTDLYTVKQVRNCNRKLFKGARSHLKNTAPRFVKGFQRYDKVDFKGIECFVFGRRTSGSMALRKLDGTVVHNSAGWKQCKLLESASTLLTERRAVSSPD